MGSGSSARAKYTPVTVWQANPHAKVDPAAAGGSAGSAAAGPEQSGREALHVGATVRLCNLKAAPELNNNLGTCLSFDPSTNRWKVRLESGEEKAVKAENAVVEPVRVGVHVRITGLQSDAVLNGMIGVVESYDASTGRWTVRLSGGVKKALKGQNLNIIQGTIKTEKERNQDEKDKEEEEERMKRLLHSGNYFDIEGSPLFAALQCGSVRLVRGSYFDKRLAGGLPWQRRHDMDEEDLWPPEEAAQLWAKWGSIFFVAVSYSWLSPEHSDPESWHLRRVAHVIREWRQAAPLLCNRLLPRSSKVQDKLPDVGLFVDFVCLHQQHKSGATREEVQYRAALDVMDLIYGHEHTSVWQCASVPGKMPRKYHHRGWTCFESCVAGNKAYPEDKIYCFGDMFDPDSEATAKTTFLRKYKLRHAPPCSPERFAEMLWRCEEEVKNVWAPHNKMFTEPKDKTYVVAKFREAWESHRRVRELDCKGLGWGDAEALQLASLLQFFPHLESIHLTGNNIGDRGAEAILGALLGSQVRYLDLGDNRITAAGASAMVTALPLAAKLEILFAFANPFCIEDTARWQLTTAWHAAGKHKPNLVLDHFALQAK